MLIVLAAALAAQATPAPAPQPSPNEIAAAAPASDWVTIPATDLLVMELVPDAAGVKRTVVIQLMPAPFSQGWIGNIRKLATARWWDGTSVNRVQDNYVVQWGDATEKKVLPQGLAMMTATAYTVDQIGIQASKMKEPRTRTFEREIRDAMSKMSDATPFEPEDIQSTKTAKAKDGWHERDSYASYVQFDRGWPMGVVGERADARFWPVHCYGMVGVGRNLAPDTGSGAELYTVIGHAPRHLDRNIALVGRVIAGIEHLSSLPRGTSALGFYEKPEQRVTIKSIRLATALPEAERPRFEYLSTESASFARYAEARANRRDPFFNVPAGGADICNIPVPIRAAAAR